MDELLKLEREVQAVYQKQLTQWADRVGFHLPGIEKQATGRPSVLFLGNHSSGKSSFINYLLEADLQKTGLAPTDDGFTLITYGEKQDQFDGQTVVTHPELVYRDLERLGPAFLGRLRLKTYPHPLLKEITLIDSPGMIDAAGTANSRGYDFTSSVRSFAEGADLILFCFDPDKPGTTGETVSIFTETLAGLEHKLLIIMNKVDLFANIRDFARTYGTLCWNLAKTIKTKDIPHIFNTYLPLENPGAMEGHIPLGDFDLSRDEVVREIQRAPTRRADNLVSDLYNNARKLALHTRVITEASSHYRAARNKVIVVIVALLLVEGVLSWAARGAESWKTPALIALLGVAGAAVAWFGGQWLIKRIRRQAESEEGIDLFFLRAYRTEFGLHDRADLHALWKSIKEQALAAVRTLGISSFPNKFACRKAVRRLDQVMGEEVPRLRRSISSYYRELQAGTGEPLPTAGDSASGVPESTGSGKRESNPLG